MGPAKKVIFYCAWNHGDIHSNKEYVRQIADAVQLAGLDVIYTTARNPKTTNLPIKYEFIGEYPDLAVNPYSFYDPAREALCINTWVGHFGMYGHTFSSQYDMWGTLFEMVEQYTGVHIPRRPVETYVSDLDLDLIELPVISDNPNKVMFCNGIGTSGQTYVGQHESTINLLAEKYPTIEFYCTHPVETSHTNVLFTDVINNRTEGGQDLVECAYISEHCQLIVTNSSGVGTFAMTKKNFFNPDKTIIAFVVSDGNTFWKDIPGVQCKAFWTPTVDDNEIFKIIDEEIKLRFEGKI